MISFFTCFLIILGIFSITKLPSGNQFRRFFHKKIYVVDHYSEHTLFPTYINVYLGFLEGFPQRYYNKYGQLITYQADQLEECKKFIQTADPANYRELKYYTQVNKYD